jgi:hypothetical protein
VNPGHTAVTVTPSRVYSLAGRVGRPRDEAGDGGDVDDAAAAAAHDAERGVHEPHGCLDVEAEVAHLILDVVVGELQRQSEPGVVHEDVDRMLRIDDPRDDPLHAVGVDEVRGQHLDGDPVRIAQIGRQLLERLGGTCDEDEVGASPRELACELRAEPGARTRDQGDRHQRSYPRNR